MNYLKLLIFHFAILSLCTGCNNEKFLLSDKAKSISDFPIKKKLIFSDVFDYKNGIIKNIFIKDSSLIIFNSSKRIEYFFYLFSLKEKKLSEGFLRKGSGPNEAIGAFCSGVTGNMLWTYDGTLKKILSINLDTVVNGNDMKMLDFSEYPLKSDFHYQMCFDNNSDFFYSIGDTESKYKIQKFSLTNNKKYDEFGVFGHLPKNISMEGVKDACQAFIYFRPMGNSIVLAYRFTDLIEVYNLDDKSEFATKGPIGMDLELKFNKNRSVISFLKDDETRKTFVNGAVTNKYIYLVYSGKRKSDFEWSYGGQIYVYDWKGNPIKELQFDKDILGLAVSEDDKDIYAYTVNGKIVKAIID